MSRVKTTAGGLLLFLAFASDSLAQGYRDESSWSTFLSMYGPLVLLVVIWLFIMSRMVSGKGGYRKFMADSQERMAQIEKHLAEISRQLERIAASLERK